MAYAIVNGKKYYDAEAAKKFAEALDKLKTKYPKAKDVRDLMNPYLDGIITQEVYREITSLVWKKFFGFTLGHVPYSYQSKSEKKKILREIVKSRMKNRSNLNKFYKQCDKKELILKITFFIGAKYNISDLDNLGKEVIDLMKGIVFPDDKQIKVLILKKEFVGKSKYRGLHEQVVVGIKTI